MVITTAVSLLPIIFGLIVYDKLPDQVPTHWNAAGEIDGWSSKTFAVFGLPCFMAVIGLLVQLGLSADPKRRNMPNIMVKFSAWICPLLSLFLVPSTLLAGMGHHINIALITCLIVGAVFLVIGNYLPKCKQTYTMGIRLPWTLNSEENWNRTHRMSGKLWILGGLLFIILGFIAGNTNAGLVSAILFGNIAAMIIVPTVYSYLLYKRGI